MQAGDPFKGKAYLLINQAQDLALKLAESDYKKYP